MCLKILWVMLRYTVLGQNMTAMGKNELAATMSAVSTRIVRIITYALSGFMGGLAGLSIVAQAGSASASGLGSDLLLPGIAAALIGGTSISGAHPPHVVECSLFETQIGASFSNVQIGALLVVGHFRSPTYRDISVTQRRLDDLCSPVSFV